MNLALTYVWHLNQHAWSHSLFFLFRLFRSGLLAAVKPLVIITICTSSPTSISSPTYSRISVRPRSARTVSIPPTISPSPVSHGMRCCGRRPSSWNCWPTLINICSSNVVSCLLVHFHRWLAIYNRQIIRSRHYLRTDYTLVHSHRWFAIHEQIMFDILMGDSYWFGVCC